MATGMKCFPVVVFLCAAVLAGTAYGQVYNVGNFDVYQYAQPQVAPLTPMPDVDKAGVPLPGPNPLDNSCWQATAANLLAGAGYGTGLTPQQRGDNIYNQIIGGARHGQHRPVRSGRRLVALHVRQKPERPGFSVH